MIRNILLAAAMLGATTVAGAATSPDASGPTLIVNQGTVMVNDGSQFVTARPGQVLKSGDRVLVMQGGRATLNYGNGHTSQLLPGTMADISLSSAASYGSAKKVGPMYAQAIGDTDNNTCHDSDGRAVPCAAAVVPASENTAGLYTAFVGGVALAIILDSNHSHRRSISAP